MCEQTDKLEYIDNICTTSLAEILSHTIVSHIFYPKTYVKTYEFSLLGILLRWGFLIWELIFIYCGLFVLILVVFVLFLLHYVSAKFQNWRRPEVKFGRNVVKEETTKKKLPRWGQKVRNKWKINSRMWIAIALWQQFVFDFITIWFYIWFIKYWSI